MNKHVLAKALILTAVVVVIVSIAGFTQGRGPGGAGPMYNTATETTIQGTVQEVKQFTGPRGVTGTDVILKTDQGTQDVRLGPSPFLAQNQFAVEQGDELQVKGSKIQLNGADIILAREVKKGEQTLTLRDAKGFPVWSRRGRP